MGTNFYGKKFVWEKFFNSKICMGKKVKTINGKKFVCGNKFVREKICMGIFLIEKKKLHLKKFFKNQLITFLKII
jgi:hypothetical protein